MRRLRIVQFHGIHSIKTFRLFLGDNAKPLKNFIESVSEDMKLTHDVPITQILGRATRNLHSRRPDHVPASPFLPSSPATQNEK